MVIKDEYQDSEWRAYTGGHMTRKMTVHGDNDYYMGPVYTDHGIVEAYTQGDENNFELTMLEFIYQGRYYRRRFPRRYSKRYVVTLARRFAREKAKTQTDLNRMRRNAMAVLDEATRLAGYPEVSRVEFRVKLARVFYDD